MNERFREIITDNPSRKTKFGTFNIRGAEHNDSHNIWRNRRDFNVDVVLAIDADLLGVQESQYENLDYYQRNLLGYEHFLGPKLADQEFNPIYWKKDRFSLDTSGDIHLNEAQKPNTPAIEWDAHDPRGATWAVLHDHTTAERILFVNYHPDHKSDRARYESARIILRRISEIGRMPSVITADFNEGDYKPHLDIEIKYTGNGLKLLKEHGYEDTYYVAGLSDTPHSYTFHNFEGDNYNAAGSHGLHRVDMIFVRGFDTLTAEIISASKPLNGNPEKILYPSDHYPVVATVI